MSTAIPSWPCYQTAVEFLGIFQPSLVKFMFLLLQTTETKLRPYLFSPNKSTLSCITDQQKKPYSFALPMYKNEDGQS